MESLVGRIGVAVGELRPDGQVKVNGEIWSARCDDGCDAGAAVVVRAIDGLTLSVAPARRSHSSDGSDARLRKIGIGRQ